MIRIVDFIYMAPKQATVITLIGVVLGLSACSFVSLDEKGAWVQERNSNQVANCDRLGNTTSNVLGKLGFIPRSEKKQTAELLILAKNEAGAMGGNVVVAESEITNGARRFGVYKCPDVQ